MNNTEKRNQNDSCFVLNLKCIVELILIIGIVAVFIITLSGFFTHYSCDNNTFNRKNKIQYKNEKIEKTFYSKEYENNEINVNLKLFASLITVIVLAFGIIQWLGDRKMIDLIENFMEKQEKAYEKAENSIKEQVEIKFEALRKENIRLIDKNIEEYLDEKTNKFENDIKRTISRLVRQQLEEIMLLTGEARQKIVAIYRDGISKSVKALKGEIAEKCGCNEINLNSYENNLLMILLKHNILLGLYSEDLKFIENSLMQFNIHPFTEAEKRLEYLRVFLQTRDPQLVKEVDKALRKINELKIKKKNENS